MTEVNVADLFARCSNVGRWGPDDELGTLNYITPEKRIAAAGLVRLGKVIRLGRDLETRPSRKNPTPIVHRMLYVGHRDPIASLDEFTIAPHGYAVTHLDAVGHVYFRGEIWNGRKASEVVRPYGLEFASIYAMREGVFTRGILLDVARARGVAWLEPGDDVTPDDLEAAEDLAGVRAGRADAIFVRVGLAAREAIEGPEDPGVRAGLSIDCVPWLHDREIAVWSGDCIERLPQPDGALPMPLHQLGFVAMGLAILDNPNLEELADFAATSGRHEFLLTCAPLPIPGGTGSPVNPLCVF